MIASHRIPIKEKRVLCLSPHHDDLLYSSALTVRLLREQGFFLTNVCLFTKSCWTANGIVEDVEVISSVRLQEEEAAAVAYEYTSVSLGLSDSAVRGLDADEELSVSICPEMLQKCEKRFCEWMGTQSFDVILMPLAAGGHIDHRYTRMIGEMQKGISIRLYYEDMPYLTDPQQAYAYIPDGAQPFISRGILAEKLRGFHCYPSQAEPQNRERICRYSQQIVENACAERIWLCRAK